MPHIQVISNSHNRLTIAIPTNSGGTRGSTRRKEQARPRRARVRAPLHGAHAARLQIVGCDGRWDGMGWMGLALSIICVCARYPATNTAPRARKAKARARITHTGIGISISIGAAALDTRHWGRRLNWIGSDWHCPLYACAYGTPVLIQVPAREAHGAEAGIAYTGIGIGGAQMRSTQQVRVRDTQVRGTQRVQVRGTQPLRTRARGAGSGTDGTGRAGSRSGKQ